MKPLYTLEQTKRESIPLEAYIRMRIEIAVWRALALACGIIIGIYKLMEITA